MKISKDLLFKNIVRISFKDEGDFKEIQNKFFQLGIYWIKGGKKDRTNEVVGEWSFIKCDHGALLATNDGSAGRLITARDFLDVEIIPGEVETLHAEFNAYAKKSEEQIKGLENQVATLTSLVADLHKKLVNVTPAGHLGKRPN